MRPLLHDDVFRRLCRARDAIHARYAEPLTVSDLAREAGLSRYHFIRLFREAFAQTPHRYLVDVRLDRARSLLRAGERSITDVCADVGFSSLGSFSALFAKRVGCPPSGFRRRLVQVVGFPAALPRLWIPHCFLSTFGSA